MNEKIKKSKVGKTISVDMTCGAAVADKLLRDGEKNVVRGMDAGAVVGGGEEFLRGGARLQQLEHADVEELLPRLVAHADRSALRLPFRGGLVHSDLCRPPRLEDVRVDVDEELAEEVQLGGDRAVLLEVLFQALVAQALNLRVAGEDPRRPVGKAGNSDSMTLITRALGSPLPIKKEF